MDLCDSCKQEKCNKLIETTYKDGITTIKCYEYVKDESKTKGYVESLDRTAPIGPTVMPGLISNWRNY